MWSGRRFPCQPRVLGSYAYTGSKQTVKITKSDFYTLSGTTSATGVGTYTVTASLNDRVNTAWSDGSTADVTLTWSIGKKPMSKLTYSSVSSQTYTGGSLRPRVTVKDGSRILKVGTDYSITYSSNKSVGMGKITLKGKGGYVRHENHPLQDRAEKDRPLQREKRQEQKAVGQVEAKHHRQRVSDSVLHRQKRKEQPDGNRQRL